MRDFFLYVYIYIVKNHMKKVFRISESQLKTIIEQEISEVGRRGAYKEEWNEDDQTLAFFNARYGVEELGFTLKEIAENVIGTSIGSLQKQTANFKYLMGFSGLDRPNKMQTEIYNKYKTLGRQEFKNLCLDIIENNANNPEKQKSTLKLGRQIGKKRESINKERLDALSKTLKGRDSSRFTLIGSRLKREPNGEQEDENGLDVDNEVSTKQPKTPIDDVREFLSILSDTVQKIKSSGELSMLDALSDDIDFIKDFIDTELSPKSGLSESKKVKKIIITESQLKNLIENKKKTLTESSFNYETYHDTYSSAIREALEYVERRGYETEGDDVWNNISVGPKKPSEGETNKITLTLYKNGKEQRKALHIQVYNTGKKYELNVYIN
jgi:hypothetical protein